MDPVSGGLMLASTALKVRSSLKAGNRNRRIAYGQALEEERAGVAEQARIRDAARKAMGDQIGAQFGNGFLGGTGSAIDALAESQINAALDALNVRREAAGKARSLRAQGDQARAEGRMGALEGLIGGASQAYGMSQDWANAQRGTSAPRKTG